MSKYIIALLQQTVFDVTKNKYICFIFCIKIKIKISKWRSGDALIFENQDVVARGVWFDCIIWLWEGMFGSIAYRILKLSDGVVFVFTLLH